MHSAKEAVIRHQPFFDSMAWRTPREISILPKSVLAARREVTAGCPPRTAAMGETRAARLAGAWAARSTVMTPTAAPLTRPAGLSEKTGVVANSPPIP